MSIDDDLKYVPKHTHCETLIDLPFYPSYEDAYGEIGDPIYLPAGTEIRYVDPYASIWQTKQIPTYYAFILHALENVAWRKVYG